MTLALGQNQVASLMDWFTPNAHASMIQEVKFCFKRLRFKSTQDLSDDSSSSSSSSSSSNSSSSSSSGNSSGDSNDDDEDNIDLNLGEVNYSPSLGAQEITSVTVPADDYRRIEFDLDNNCSKGYSILVNNGSVLSSSDHIKIKFEGKFNATTSEAKLILGLDSIIAALETVSQSSELGNTLEGTSGSF